MKVIILIAYLFVFSYAYAQPFQFKSFTTKDGLSSNNINTMAKDANGFLWVATNNGLNRFDGNAFDVFYNNPKDSLSIASNGVQDIFIDSKKNIWLGTFAGISKFNDHTQLFENYAPDTLLMPKISQAFFALNEDSKGNIWMGGWYDLLIFNPVTKKFSSSGWASFANKAKPVNGYHSRVVILSIEKKSIQEFWVLTTYGLFSVNTISLSFQFYPNPKIPDYFGCYISYIDNEKNLWINAYLGGIFFFNATSKTWENYPVPPSYFKATIWNIAAGITPYNGDTLIFSANKSLVFFDKKKKQFLHTLTNNKEDELSLPNAYYNNIFKDSSFYWLMTTGNGIVRMSKQKTLFQYNELPTLPRGFYKLFSSKSTGKIIAGDFSSKTVFFDPVSKKSNDLHIHTTTEVNSVVGYAEINATEAYLCTDNNLFKFNPLSLQVVEIKLPEKKFKENDYSVRTIVVDNQKNIWVRSRNQGIFTYNPITGSTRFIDIAISSQEKEYAALWYDSMSNTLIVAVANEGVYLYDIEKKTTQHFLLNVLPSYRGASINSIVGYANGDIYMADNFNGLYFFNSIHKKITRFTTYDGLLDNVCTGLTIDAKGYLWVATYTGLSRLDTNTYRFTNYAREKNYPEYSDFITSDNDGNIYQAVQAKAGYHSWNTNDLLKPSSIGKIYLRNSKLNEKYIPLDSVYKFSATENNISFQFGYLLLYNDASVQLEYKLNDADWILLDKDDKISFSNLAPNKYKLFVRNKDLAISPIYIQFDIAPPFYKTWWFILLSICSIILLVLLFVKWREKSIKTIAAEKLKVQQLNAEQFKNKLEVEKIINYFSTSLTDKNKVDDVLWDIAKNLIGRLGFEDCMIYLWNADKTKMIQKAGFGPKGSSEEIMKNHFDVSPGQGVVGYVIQTKQPVLIPDTSKDSRYRPDEMVRLSEIAVPVIFNDELIGVIDSEHPEKNFFTSQHLQIMSTIATLMGDKIKTIEAEASLQQQHSQMHVMNEQLSNAKLEALRSQMNPHFIFNCISSIDNFILDNDAANASAYLNKFAKLIRNILDNSRNNVVSFWKDWETLSYYIDLEKLRSDNSFSYNIVADPELLNGHYKIPPLIIQPYVENAILHGLRPLQNRQGLLEINASLQNGILQYSIKDNGVGRHASSQQPAIKKDHDSFGLELTEQRVNLFNTALKDAIIIADLKDEQGNATGTLITISLKV
jgi:ligand-binding sensor domain-containing protein/putative methionine-R-sulfoxide reductase with GAF domain